MSVLAFTPREQESPHLSGEARCIACSHKWVAVVPAGVTWIECPSCGTEKGLLRFRVEPDIGEQVWQCNCGCHVFYYTPGGAHCYNCGVVQVFP